MTGNAPLLRHIAAKLEPRADREPDRIMARLQQVGEQMIVYKVGLHDQAEVFRDVERDAAAESVESGPFFFHARRRDGVHHNACELIDRMRRGGFVNDARGRPYIRCNTLEAAVGELRAGGEGLRDRSERQSGHIVGRDETGCDESGKYRVELVLQCGGRLTQVDSGAAASAAVVESQTDMPRPARSSLDVEAGLEQTELRAVQKHISGIDQEAADILVFRG